MQKDSQGRDSISEIDRTKWTLQFSNAMAHPSGSD
jgi:hypothetical protein